MYEGRGEGREEREEGKGENEPSNDRNVTTSFGKEVHTPLPY